MIMIISDAFQNSANYSLKPSWKTVLKLPGGHLKRLVGKALPDCRAVLVGLGLWLLV